MTDVFVVLVTAPTGEKAHEIARDLVEKNLAACVNIVAGVRSVYRWDGAIQDDQEDLLVIKTSRARLPELIARVREVHPYSVPEVVALPVEAGHADYLAWVLAETRSAEP